MNFLGHFDLFVQVTRHGLKFADLRIQSIQLANDHPDQHRGTKCGDTAQHRKAPPATDRLRPASRVQEIDPMRFSFRLVAQHAQQGCVTTAVFGRHERRIGRGVQARKGIEQIDRHFQLFGQLLLQRLEMLWIAHQRHDLNHFLADLILSRDDCPTDLADQRSCRVVGRHADRAD
ncbi:MAG: hypothetical protein EA424_15725 [Planctomycetaceae bacterium]|nr:MAG: hypothetical protein EA424_15725 [Planctomycetaceae bacterium]